MVKINLIGKKRREAGTKNWIIVILVLIFSVFTVYFLGISIYVVTKLYLANNALRSVDREAETISTEMTANSKQLQNFILSKNILTKVESLIKEKFPYSKYLDQLSGFIPPDGVLKNVDFGQKNWVTVSVSLPGGKSLKTFQTNITDPNLINASTFSSIYSESFSRDTTGMYGAKLQFELKKDAGN